jgi:hypothetical protein
MILPNVHDIWSSPKSPMCFVEIFGQPAPSTIKSYEMMVWLPSGFASIATIT